jgi:pimeloyl-ACP methyl ester carboxylesterase
MIDTRTRTLDAPGATIAYDILGHLDGATAAGPALFMLGSPMEALGFGSLAPHFEDRPVITYDPRGVGRSVRTDSAAESTPEQHADDIRRVIEAVGGAPIDIFASSGGAVNCLALVARHPELVRILVAHEPPLAAFLPDRAEVLAANADIGATYRRSGSGPAMAKFLRLVMVEGPVPSFAGEPDPDPAAFGLPVDDDGTRDDPLLGQNNRSCVPFEPDVAALRAAPTRIVLASGVESATQMTGRAAVATAEALGVELVMFPSGHAGFLGGEFGQHGDPDAFAITLRQVLDGS